MSDAAFFNRPTKIAFPQSSISCGTAADIRNFYVLDKAE
jgi:hypothetical protein